KDPNTRIPLFSGAIAVAPTDPTVIYLGTGEANNSADSYYGTGVYKSTDSGRTWTLLTGTNNSNPFKGLTISKIVVDPLNQNIIYAAVANNGVNGSGVPGRVGKTGIWKYDGTKWINLTQIASAYRTSRNLGPGPDDDDNTIFSASEDYTDVA